MCFGKILFYHLFIRIIFVPKKIILKKRTQMCVQILFFEKIITTLCAKNIFLKNRHKMKLTSFFRDQLGLSQEMMAIHLAVTKSQLSMYESGKRELPNTALTKLAELAVFFDQNKISEEPESEVQKEQELKLKAFLAIQIKELEYKKLKEQRRLEKIQKKYKQNNMLYKWALHLRENKVTLSEVVLHQATKGMEQNGLVSQMIQKMKLETITTQLDYFQSLK